MNAGVVILFSNTVVLGKSDRRWDTRFLYVEKAR